MSTKIYNGYKMPLMSAVELRDFCLKINQKRMELFPKQMERGFYKHLINMIDTITFHPYCEFYFDIMQDEKLRQDRPLINFQWDYTNTIRKCTEGTSKSDFSYSFSLCFFPLKKEMLVMVFDDYNTKPLTEYFESLDGVEEFCYYDNSDQPEGITNRQWKARYTKWEKALGKNLNELPADMGILYQPALNTLIFSLDLSWKNLSENYSDLFDIEKRYKKISKNFELSKQYCNKTGEEIVFDYNKSLNLTLKNEEELLTFAKSSLVPITKELMLETKLSDFAKQMKDKYGLPDVKPEEPKKDSDEE